MPELPEVETIRSQLERTIVGQKIIDIEVRNASKLRGTINFLLNQRIRGVRRFSKLLVIDTSADLSLAVHLKMTGKLLLDVATYEDDKHTHLLISFASGSRLIFHDYRRFGTLEVLSTPLVPSIPYIQRLGKEFFSTMTRHDFIEIVQETKRPIKVTLLDQSLMAGVGNIYANEALWRAKIHPATQAHTLSLDALTILYEALETVMNAGLERGGASSADFIDLFGKSGKAQHYFDVYGRSGQPCLRCKASIQKVIFRGRGTYFCPTCQLPERDTV